MKISLVSFFIFTLLFFTTAQAECMVVFSTTYEDPCPCPCYERPIHHYRCHRIKHRHHCVRRHCCPCYDPCRRPCCPPPCPRPRNRHTISVIMPCGSPGACDMMMPRSACDDNSFPPYYLNNDCSRAYARDCDGCMYREEGSIYY